MLQEVSTIEILIMNRVKYFRKETKWLASVLGKIPHDTQGEMSTQEVAYKSDKKHLKRGL